MDIECKLKRDGGSRITLPTATGKVEYHFAPLADGAQVAKVEIEAHQDRLLGIPEAYRLYRGGEKVKPGKPTSAQAPAPTPEPTGVPQPASDAAPTILLGSSEHPASFDIHGKTYALGDVVALAHAASGLSADDWNALADASRADLIDEQLDKLSEAPAPTAAPAKAPKKTKQ